MQINDLESAIIGMNKMFYFSMNLYYAELYYSHPWNDTVIKEYLPKFLGDIEWGCNLSHIIDKWKSCAEHCQYSAMYRFYTELDSENRRKLLEYICENYNDECRI